MTNKNIYLVVWWVGSGRQQHNDDGGGSGTLNQTPQNIKHNNKQTT